MLITEEKAISLLQSEWAVSLPTETVYGLAAKIDSEKAIASIFSIKQRPFFDPLIVHVSSIEQAQKCVSAWPAPAQQLAEIFWPGPLTLVLPKSPLVSSAITSGLDTVGLRMPAHPIFLNIIKHVGIPLAAPSANMFGKTSPTSAEHVLNEFQNLVPVVDGGPCTVGIESTILKIDTNSNSTFTLQILRHGMISKEQINNALEKNYSAKISWLQPLTKTKNTPTAPGQVEHHYMPSVPLIFFDEAAFARERSLITPESVELKLHSSPELAARMLYSELRTLSEKTPKPDYLYFIFQKNMTSSDWDAIKDRIYRASTYHFT